MGCTGCGGRVHVNLPNTQELKTPRLNPDGSIEFPEGHDVPDLEGYELDPDDDRKLIPVDPVRCGYRITGIMLQKDGTYKPHHVCRMSKCEHKGKPVTFDICRQCPFRAPEN